MKRRAHFLEKDDAKRSRSVENDRHDKINESTFHSHTDSQERKVVHGYTSSKSKRETDWGNKGYDNSTPHFKDLCISRIPNWISYLDLEDGLLVEFERYGKVSVKIANEGSTRLAYIRFANKEDAKRALKSIEDYPLLLADRRVDVVPCLQRNFKHSDSERKAGHSSWSKSSLSKSTFSKHHVLPEYDAAAYGEKQIIEPKKKFNKNEFLAPTRVLFVGNLPHDIQKDELVKTFRPYGKILDVDIKRVTNVSKCYAFIKFSDTIAAQKAKKELNNAFFGIRQCKIGFGQLDETKTQSTATASTPEWKSLMVTKFPNHFKLVTLHFILKEKFEGFGSLKIKMTKTDEGKPKVAFLNFKYPSEAKAAYKKNRILTLEGHLVEISPLSIPSRDNDQRDDINSELGEKSSCGSEKKMENLCSSLDYDQVSNVDIDIVETISEVSEDNEENTKHTSNSESKTVNKCRAEKKSAENGNSENKADEQKNEISLPLKVEDKEVIAKKDDTESKDENTSMNVDDPENTVAKENSESKTDEQKNEISLALKVNDKEVITEKDDAKSKDESKSIKVEYPENTVAKENSLQKNEISLPVKVLDTEIIAEKDDTESNDENKSMKVDDPENTVDKENSKSETEESKNIKTSINVDDEDIIAVKGNFKTQTDEGNTKENKIEITSNVDSDVVEIIYDDNDENIGYTSNSESKTDVKVDDTEDTATKENTESRTNEKKNGITSSVKVDETEGIIVKDDPKSQSDESKNELTSSIDVENKDVTPAANSEKNDESKNEMTSSIDVEKKDLTPAANIEGKRDGNQTDESKNELTSSVDVEKKDLTPAANTKGKRDGNQTDESKNELTSSIDVEKKDLTPAANTEAKRDGNQTDESKNEMTSSLKVYDREVTTADNLESEMDEMFSSANVYDKQIIAVEVNFEKTDDCQNESTTTIKIDDQQVIAGADNSESRTDESKNEMISTIKVDDKQVIAGEDNSESKTDGSKNEMTSSINMENKGVAAEDLSESKTDGSKNEMISSIKVDDKQVIAGEDNSENITDESKNEMTSAVKVDEKKVTAAKDKVPETKLKPDEKASSSLFARNLLFGKDEKKHKPKIKPNEKASSSKHSVKDRKRHEPEIKRDEKASSNLFIGNLPIGASENELHKLFVKYGQIESVVMKMPENNRPYAFVKYMSMDSAQRAQVKMNGYMFKNNILNVSYKLKLYEKPTSRLLVGSKHSGKDRERHEPELKLDETATSNLFVRNLPVGASENDLSKLFVKYGQIESVIMKRPQNNRPYAFVKYLSMDSAQRAQVRMNGYTFKNQVLNVGYTKSPVTSCLWVGGLGSWLDAKTLKKELKSFGEIKKFLWPKRSNFAYVQYEDDTAAQAACHTLHFTTQGRKDKRLRLDFISDKNMITEPEKKNKMKTDVPEKNVDYDKKKKSEEDCKMVLENETILSTSDISDKSFISFVSSGSLSSISPKKRKRRPSSIHSDISDESFISFVSSGSLSSSSPGKRKCRPSSIHSDISEKSFISFISSDSLDSSITKSEITSHSRIHSDVSDRGRVLDVEGGIWAPFSPVHEAFGRAHDKDLKDYPYRRQKRHEREYSLQRRYSPSPESQQSDYLRRKSHPRQSIVSREHRDSNFYRRVSIYRDRKSHSRERSDFYERHQKSSYDSISSDSSSEYSGELRYRDYEYRRGLRSHSRESSPLYSTYRNVEDRYGRSRTAVVRESTSYSWSFQSQSVHPAFVGSQNALDFERSFQYDSVPPTFPETTDQTLVRYQNKVSGNSSCGSANPVTSFPNQRNIPTGPLYHGNYDVRPPVFQNPLNQMNRLPIRGHVATSISNPVINTAYPPPVINPMSTSLHPTKNVSHGVQSRPSHNVMSQAIQRIVPQQTLPQVVLPRMVPPSVPFTQTNYSAIRPVQTKGVGPYFGQHQNVQPTPKGSNSYPWHIQH